MRYILAALLALAPLPAAAFCDRLQINGASWHYGESKAYHYINPGLGCEWRLNGDWRASVGTFENSFGDTTVYTAAEWLPLKYGALRLGLATAAFYGYDNPIVIPPVPAVSYEGRRWGTTVYITGKVAMIHFTYNNSKF